MMDDRSDLTAFQTDEGRYKLLVDAITDYAVYMLDPAGRVISWNAGAERFKGYRPHEIIGQHFSRFYTPEDRAAGIPAKAGSTRRAGGSARTAAASGPTWSSIRSSCPAGS